MVKKENPNETKWKLSKVDHPDLFARFAKWLSFSLFLSLSLSFSLSLWIRPLLRETQLNAYRWLVTDYSVIVFVQLTHIDNPKSNILVTLRNRKSWLWLVSLNGSLGSCWILKQAAKSVFMRRLCCSKIQSFLSNLKQFKILESGRFNSCSSMYTLYSNPIKGLPFDHRKIIIETAE